MVDNVGALAPSPPWMTPLRALLIMMSAVLGGVALSVILGSAPAHAAEGTGSGPDIPPSPVATVTSSLLGTVDRSVAGTVSTVSTAAGAGIPLVQHSVGAVEDSVATHVPVAAPIVAPITASVEAALGVVKQVVAPLDPLATFPGELLATPIENAAATATAGIALLTVALPAYSAVGSLTASPRSGGSDGVLPGPVLTGAPGSSAAGFGLVLGAFALSLLGARRRQHDETLPASPAFDVDTSPA